MTPLEPFQPNTAIFPSREGRLAYYIPFAPAYGQNIFFKGLLVEDQQGVGFIQETLRGSVLVKQAYYLVLGN